MEVVVVGNFSWGCYSGVGQVSWIGGSGEGQRQVCVWNQLQGKIGNKQNLKQQNLAQ